MAVFISVRMSCTNVDKGSKGLTTEGLIQAPV